MSRTQKIVHLAMRQEPLEVERVRGELLKMRQRAYEDELTIQARRVGCGGRSGRLTTGPSLTALNEMSQADAESIVNTYNYDMAKATLGIAEKVPTANRFVYAKRLSAWEAKRNRWKAGQIAQYTEGTARSMAQADFYRFNDVTGFAVLLPKKTAEPICAGWVKRGQVPLNVAMNNPPPYHTNCPHGWEVRAGQVPQLACPDLWVGE